MDISTIWDNHWSKIRDFEKIIDVENSNDQWSNIHKEKIDGLLTELNFNSKFLEAGCGLGQWCFYANKKYNLHATGVDFAPNTISKVNEYVEYKQIDNILFIYDDLNNSKLPHNHYDTIISLGVIIVDPNNETIY